MDKLRSRKFWIAIVGGLLIILNDQFGWGLDEASVNQFVTIAVGYILGQGAVDAVSANAEAKKYATYVGAVATTTTSSGEAATIVNGS